MYISIYPPQTPTRSLTGPCARASNRMYDDVTYVYDDVTYVYDDVTYVYDDVTYVYDDVTCVYDDVTYMYVCMLKTEICTYICSHKYKKRISQ